MPMLHAYAKSHYVIGLMVYVNCGRVEDYLKLKELGVNVSGTVVFPPLLNSNSGPIIFYLGRYKCSAKYNSF